MKIKIVLFFLFICTSLFSYELIDWLKDFDINHKIIIDETNINFIIESENLNNITFEISYILRVISLFYDNKKFDITQITFEYYGEKTIFSQEWLVEFFNADDRVQIQILHKYLFQKYLLQRKK